METIKIRAWDTQLRSYTYSGYGEKTFAAFVKRTNCDRYIKELFTTRQDKNGKDIYQGDIVDNGRNHGEVFMRLGCWYVELARELGYCNSFEIIGNIHKNKIKKSTS